MTDDAACEIELHELSAKDGFPNNERLATLIYRQVAPGRTGEALAREFERRFHAHEWSNSWRDTIYDYAHYHSTAHEVLGCYAGHARVELGSAITITIHAGDVLVLPAGVAHRCLGASEDFAVVGAYADGRRYDMKREDADLPESQRRIAEVPRPGQDPVFGRAGPLLETWPAPPRE